MQPIAPGFATHTKMTRLVLPFASSLVFACHSPPPAEAPASAQAESAQATAGHTAGEHGSAPATSGGSLASAATIHDLSMQQLDGEEVSLSAWKGKTLLIVNTASECGNTPQYEGLEALYKKYREQGFAVLGFPSNDFGGQEPGSASEIETFCTTVYGVEFPMFAKVSVKGPERAELYARLSDALGAPEWNFHKYLVDKEGRPVRAFSNRTQPEAPEVTSAIEAELAK